MQLRTFNLRYLQLNAGLIALLAVLGTKIDVAGSAIWPYLAMVPVVGLASYLFSKWQVNSGSVLHEAPSQEVDASETESQLVKATLLVPLVLGLGCAAVMVLAPEYTAKVAWVLPPLGFNLGHSAEAFERLSRE
jgi:hypothetical protein